MPVSAVDVISPAFLRMKQNLFSPFRLSQWVRLAIVGFLAGELGTGNGVAGQFSPKSIQSGSGFPSMGVPFGGGILFAVLTGLLVLLAIVLGIVFLYISSRMRFVLFDSVIAGECSIRKFWRPRGTLAFRYFVWQLLAGLCVLIGVILLFAVPLAFAYGVGWFSSPRDHLLPLILGGILLALILIAVACAVGIVKVLVKDFVVPQMVFDDVSVGEGWRRLWSMMKQEKASYVAYIGMKIVLAFAAAVFFFVATLIVLVVLLIPVGGIGAITVLVGHAAGLTWNPLTIAIAIVVGGIVLAAFLFIAALISVPATIFFPAYSMYFFAERYPALHAALYPQASPPGWGRLAPQPQ